MRALFPDLSRLHKVLSLTPRDEAQAGRVERIREPGAVMEAPVHEEILRARTLMIRIESTGVKFPVQIYDALEQARKASETNGWTLQVDRSFYSALSLLESITRAHGAGAEPQPGLSEATRSSTAEPGWTVIISNSQKMLDGNW
ncbi:hypothetical protein [Burkholderia sp. Ac-20365]|uniref:hypothetical protein n=1 Tax=Burkholderia sp. Ac-20365 TaxID=2703897 RepID=UPI00197BEF59|nr:hypothetical protein [Burkholderia sp. Ac-20365]